MVQSWLKADLPFAGEDANRYLPWVIAVMVCLTAFMAAAGLTLSSIFLDYHAEFKHRLHIQVPYADGQEDAQAEEILSHLRAIPEIAEATRVGEEALYTMLEPWVGSRDALDLLPVPVLLEVRVQPEAYAAGLVSAETVRAALAESFPDSVVDDYRQWVDDFQLITSKIRQMLYAVAALMLLAAVTIVLLITRTSVQMHFPIVRLLHRMGAEDGYITHQFQLNASRLTLKGATVGVVAGAVLFLPALRFLSAFDLPLLPDPGLTTAHFILFITLPLFICACVAIVTWFSVQTMLRRVY